MALECVVDLTDDDLLTEVKRRGLALGPLRDVGKDPRPGDVVFLGPPEREGAPSWAWAGQHTVERVGDGRVYVEDGFYFFAASWADKMAKWGTVVTRA